MHEVTTNRPGGEDSAHSTAVPKEAAESQAAQSLPADRTRPEQALVVLDLTKTFRSGFLRRPDRGVEGVSFSVNKGEVFALIGHNGAGKTTTINCILDLIRPDRGEVTILGQDNHEPESRREIGYLPERPNFFEHLSGRELLNFYGQLLDLPRQERSRRVAAVLQQLGLAGVAERKLRKYSKGMLQRIGLAQALLGDPSILILDEPMSGLDPLGRRQVREMLLELKGKGKTIILSSHIVHDVEMLADSVGILKHGRLIRTQQLAEFHQSCSYEVRLGAGSEQGQDQPEGARQVIVDDVDQLRDLLASCHQRNTPVLAVETRRTGLEELYLQVHNEAGGSP